MDLVTCLASTGLNSWMVVCRVVRGNGVAIVLGLSLVVCVNSCLVLFGLFRWNWDCVECVSVCLTRV